MNYEKYYWLNEESRIFLKRDYLREGITPEERIDEIAQHAEGLLGLEGFATKFIDYMARGFYSLATPVWTNFGTQKGLPVSCFGHYVPDTMLGILDSVKEMGMMTKAGGGTSGYFGDLRPRGSRIVQGEGKSSGPVHFMEIFDTTSNVVSQGATRRGSYAAYLPVEHPDIMEFLEMREDASNIHHLSLGVTITNKWIDELKARNPKNMEVMARIIKKRFEKGYPYIIFIDNANDAAPQVYKDKGMKILHSNLCSEIMLADNEDESFVCVLSSLNLRHWDEIEQTDAVETLLFFLDAVNEEFVQKSKHMPGMEKAYRFAHNQRALGLGALGWHSYLQSKMIPFESLEAKMHNSKIWSTISQRCESATREMADIYGEAPLMKGYGKRNTTCIAIAPTTSSSFILGQSSPSIEPLNGNYFVKELAKGTFTYINPYFVELLERHGQNNQDVRMSVLKRGGSVRHLDFLSDHEKDVFKTFSELSQKEVIIQAAQRQKYIDQGQSLNINLHPSTTVKETLGLILFAHEMGVKGFYYQRGANPAQELSRSNLECISCEG